MKKTHLLNVVILIFIFNPFGASAEETFSTGQAIHSNTPIGELTVLGESKSRQQIIVYSEESSKETEGEVESKGSILLISSKTGEIKQKFFNLCRSSFPLGVRGMAFGGCDPDQELEKIETFFEETESGQTLKALIDVDHTFVNVNNKNYTISSISDLVEGQCEVSDIGLDARIFRLQADKFVITLEVTSQKCKLKPSIYNKKEIHLFILPFLPQENQKPIDPPPISKDSGGCISKFN